MWRSLCRAACIVPLWGWTVVTVGAVLWLTLSPDPLPESDVRWFDGADKIVHGLMFLGIYLSAIFDISRKRVLVSPGVLPGVWSRVNLAGWVLLLGALIELLQPYSGRTCDFVDFVADASGVLAGFCISGVLMRRLWG